MNTDISFDLKNEESDRMYLDYLQLFSTGVFFRNLELHFVFTQLILNKLYLLVLTKKNNFEMVVRILGFTLFPADKNHEVVSTPSSTEKKWMRLVFSPFYLPPCVYLLPLIGIILFIT